MNGPEFCDKHPRCFRAPAHPGGCRTEDNKPLSVSDPYGAGYLAGLEAAAQRFEISTAGLDFYRDNKPPGMHLDRVLNWAAAEIRKLKGGK